LSDNVSEEDLKETAWKGFVAMPVPDTMTALSDDAKADPYPARLETLQYGLVAEIVHYGPYEDETPTIERLQQYITDQGYEIAGLHEEEYIKGPGMPFSRPKDYITVIRYQVRKK
jgi:effector-binding domain-containing protein